MSEVLSIISQDKLAGASRTSALGERGELLAVDFIERLGYRVVMTNFKVPVGRNSRGVQVSGEIDIIALEDDTLCFIEVKTRESEEFAGALANVNLRKQRQIARTARVYKRMFGIAQMPHRYDAVSVVIEKGLAPRIELFRAFWTEARFKKRSWGDVPN